MKLDRNSTDPKRGKYALIKLRVAKPVPLDQHGIHHSVETEAIDYGSTPETDFFVIRLKDKYAAPALAAYAWAALRDDPEYAKEVLDLAILARDSPHKHKPD